MKSFEICKSFSSPEGSLYRMLRRMQCEIVKGLFDFCARGVLAENVCMAR